MTTAQECQDALQKLAGRLSEMKPGDRDDIFGNRTLSVTIPDLGVTLVTRLGTGEDPVREAKPDEPPADIRLTANSAEVLSLAESPMNIGRAWVAGRVKIEASMRDLFRLRRLLLPIRLVRPVLTVHLSTAVHLDTADHWGPAVR